MSAQHSEFGPCACPICAGQGGDHAGDQASGPMQAPPPQEAAPVFSNDQVIDQIDSGWRWTNDGSTAASITFGVTTGNGWFPSYYDEYAGWLALNVKQAAAAVASIGLWDDLIAASITPAADPNAADIRFSSSTTGVSYAHAYYPGATNQDTYSWQAAQGSIWLNPFYSSLSDPDVGEYGFMAILHEIGHTLGLSHPGSYNGGSPTYQNDADYAQDTHQYTVMSYFDAENTGADWYGGNGQWYWAQTPMLHDVLVVQSIYGADYATRAGDTTYGFNATAGNAVYDFSQNAHPVLTIWDGGGNDTLDLSGWNTDSTISLLAGSYSHANAMTSNIAIAFGADIENAVGGGGNDVITGNALNNILDGSGGNDQLFGGAGDDVLIGGAGRDILAGGVGDDTYLVDDSFDIVDEGAAFPAFAGSASDFDTILSTADWFWDVYGVGERIVIEDGAAGSGPGEAGSTIIASVQSNELVGNGGTNIMFGRGGADTYRPGDGIDYISLSLLGVTDENAYLGVDGPNTVIVDPRSSGAYSYDIVFEFEPGKDIIDVSGYGYASGVDVLALGHDDGVNSYYALGDGFDYLYMVGLNTSQISSDDFIVT